jgi:hypothetical protein
MRAIGDVSTSLAATGYRAEASGKELVNRGCVGDNDQVTLPLNTHELRD